MSNSQQAKITTAFENYRKVIFSLQNDIQFWKSFLSLSIDAYIKDKPKNFMMYESIFAVYDINPVTNVGYLNSHTLTEPYSIDTIHQRKEDFFNWIINLAVLKAYNATEILLLETISLKYLETDNISVHNKKSQALITSKVKDYLKNIDIENTTTNNKHLINYLKSNNEKFSMFVSQLVRIDSKTTWESFFKMFSILRHIIVHNGMIANIDTLNEIRSFSKDVFEPYFKVNSSNTLMPIQDQFLNFLLLVNDFAINSVKIIMEEKDLLFLQLG